MPEFDFSTLLPEKEKKIVATDAVALTKTKIPRVSRPRKAKIPQIDEKKLASVIGQVLDEKLQKLTTTLEKTLKASTSKPVHTPIDPENSYKNIINNLGMRIGSLQAEIRSFEPLKDKVWNEINRMKFMNSMTRPGKKGFKRHEMFTFFGSKTVSYNDIDSAVEKYKKIGFIKVGRNGWMRLTSKGKEHYDNLLEAQYNEKQQI